MQGRAEHIQTIAQCHSGVHHSWHFISELLLLQVALLATKVGLTALKALHSITAALELYENVLTPISSKQEGVGPPAPDTPQMLPSVHAMWGPLMGALKVGISNFACCTLHMHTMLLYSCAASFTRKGGVVNVVSFCCAKMRTYELRCFHAA